MSQDIDKKRSKPLYSASERQRRDQTAWTLVQGVLAPLQFIVFGISLVLVIRFLLTKQGFELATASIVVKTGLLYLIMITGAIWEKVVFGKYLFAEPFFWEDVFSMLVIALHSAYLFALLSQSVGAETQMHIALAAYGAYLINAAQFLRKFRMARRDDGSDSALHSGALEAV